MSGKYIITYRKPPLNTVMHCGYLTYVVHRKLLLSTLTGKQTQLMTKAREEKKYKTKSWARCRKSQTVTTFRNFPDIPLTDQPPSQFVQSFSEIKASRIADGGMIEETIRKSTMFQGSKDVSVDRKNFKYNARNV